MKTTFVAAMIAVATLAGVGTGFAGEGIPVMPAQPLVATTAPGVIGQSYPAFVGQHRPVVSERFAAVTGGQDYPTFAAPRQSVQSRFAAAQVGRVNG